MFSSFFDFLLLFFVLIFFFCPQLLHDFFQHFSQKNQFFESCREGYPRRPLFFPFFDFFLGEGIFLHFFLFFMFFHVFPRFLFSFRFFSFFFCFAFLFIF